MARTSTIVGGGGGPSPSIGGPITGGTTGSVLFVGPGALFAQDNTNLFYDDVSNFVGIGTNTPTEALHVVGNAIIDGKLTVTGSIDPTDILIEDSVGLAAYQEWRAGQSAAVSSANAGRIRYNATLQTFQVSENGGAYVDLSSGGTVNGSGVAGQVTFWTSVSDVSGDDQLFWNNTDKTLSLGDPNNIIDILGFPFEAQVIINRDDTTSSIFPLGGNSSGSASPSIIFARSEGSLAAPTIVSDGNSFVDMYGVGWDGTTNMIATRISIFVDGTPALGSIPGAFSFETTEVGDSSPTGRMVIRNDGKVGVGTASPNFLFDVDDSFNFGQPGSSDAWIYKGDDPFIYTPAPGTLFIGEAVGNISAMAFNFGFGFNSLNQLTTGVNNVSVGNASLVFLTTGANNVSVGNLSQQNLISGSQNVSIGSGALSGNTTGNDNVAIGQEALASSTGSSNVGIGTLCGQTDSTGADLVLIGHSADVGAVGLTNAIAIGSNSIVGASDTIVLGDSTIDMFLVMGDTVAPAGVKVYLKESSTHFQFRLESPNNTANQISFSRGTGLSYFGPSATNEFHIFGGTTSAPAPLDIVIFPGSTELVRFVGDINRSQEFQGGQSATILIARESNTALSGHIFTLQAGGSASGSTDKDGGPLLLKGGISTGTGDSEIEFYTAKAGATGTTDNFPTLKAIMNGDGRFEINAGKAGVGNRVAVGGVLETNITPVGNVTTGEDDLMTYTLPANVLGTNGDSVEINTWGTFADNANVKDVRVYFGATPILFSINGSAGGGTTTWQVKVIITRTGAATQTMQATLYGNSNIIPQAVYINNVAPAETLSSAVVIKLTGEATATDDITQNNMIIKWNPNN